MRGLLSDLNPRRFLKIEVVSQLLRVGCSWLLLIAILFLAVHQLSAQEREMRSASGDVVSSNLFLSKERPEAEWIVETVPGGIRLRRKTGVQFLAFALDGNKPAVYLADNRSKGTIWKAELGGDAEVFRGKLQASEGRFQNWYLQPSTETIFRPNGKGTVRYLTLEKSPSSPEEWKFVQVSK